MELLKNLKVNYRNLNLNLILKISIINLMVSDKSIYCHCPKITAYEQNL